MLQQVLAIVRQSGDIIRAAWNKPRKVSHKGSIDLVTDTDVAVEKFLKKSLKDIVPGAEFMAEESARSLSPPNGDCWIIDPLDGTTNFVHRLPAVATSVALWRQGRVVLGVINMPILGECFYGTEGKGAWSNEEPLRVSCVPELNQAVVATGFPYDIPKYLPQVLRGMEAVLPAAQGMRRMGAAAVDLAFVAAGRLDAFYEMDLKPWDVAAGWLLVQEAGGKVSTPSGEPFSFGHTIVASNSLVHQELVERLHVIS